MGFGTDHRNSTDIQCISGGSFIGADAAFAENNIGVSFGHDIFCSIEPLIDGADMPRFNMTGSPDWPASFNRLKFCMFLVPIWIMSTYFTAALMDSVPMTSQMVARPVISPASFHVFQSFFLQPLEE